MTLTAQMRDKAGRLPMPKPPHFLVGRNRNGLWVARDRNGCCEGYFQSRAEALGFAWHERGDGPGAVVLVPGIIELFEALEANGRDAVPCPSHEVRPVGRRVPMEV